MAKRKSTTRNAASSALNWRRKVTETEEFEGSEEYIEECSDVEREGTPSDVFNPPSTNDHKNFRKSITRKDLDCRFLGDPLPMEVAMLRWPHRYEQKSNDRRVKSSKASNDDEKLILAKCHYLKAEVDGSTIFEINDDAYVKAEDDDPPYICKIIEIFEGVNGLPYFRAQWYYRSDDTVIKKSITMREKKRLFFSEMKNDNPLDCLIEKLKIVKVTPNLDLASKEVAVQDCDYYYDMVYLLPYSTYILPPAETSGAGSESLSTISCNVDAEVAASCSRSDSDEFSQGKEPKQSEMTLLDLYCGCGAMSSGLCLGANLGQTNLITKWAVDLNEYACESLALNHPETNVRNESVDDFLQLLKEWQKLCASFSLIKSENTHEQVDAMAAEDDEADNEEESSQDENEDDPEIFEVEIIIGICYGDPKESGKPGLHFKVRWKGYGPNEDSWEPVDGLGNCRERIGEFVKKGHKEKILPLPGDVDVVCGGPPCQGISGFNRFRNIENPLADPKNEQLMVFMDVVAYLQPRFILMENVVDLVRFSEGFLGRYAMGRLVDMNYQARMGIMAAGAYGLPQFRMRVFIWGAQPSEKLPQYPLPTHDVIVRGGAPTEFENIVVAYTEESAVQLENKLILGDAISDMPDVRNNEHRDEISYDCPPKTEFQRFIRLTKDALLGFGASSELLSTLYDHRPLELNEDDYQRVCRIPKKKGANFRDLPGVRVCPDDNKVEWDPDVKREFLPSGKPLVPDYAMTFVRGTSSKPFGRLWWDETVPTVVTRAEPHNQIVLHPLQDRVLTIRENARLQGFPDCYQLKGPVKQRYIQVGNAVAVPVARALGYALAMTSQGSWSHEPLFTLPSRFPNFQNRVSSPSTEYSS